MKDLKVSYQRNLKSNWLIFEPEESFLSELSNKYAFEMGMIEHNNIRGFLRPDIKRVNSKVNICYDISSLQPLSRVFEVRALGIEEIKSFIIEIISATKALEDILLEASSIVHDPEYIYIPRNEDNREEIKSLLESILNNINTEDKDCLIMLYGMLKECRRRDFTINDLEYIPDYSLQKDMVNCEEEIIESNADESVLNDKKKKQFNIFGGIFKGNKQKEDEEISNTVLLTDKRIKNSGRILRSTNGMEDIEIGYLPFIIGKQDRICDYVLDAEGVSRLHLQFFEKENTLYVRDLNSRNGTYINGKKLENEENMEMNNGDNINICGINYRLEI